MIMNKILMAMLILALGVGIFHVADRTGTETKQATGKISKMNFVPSHISYDTRQPNNRIQSVSNPDVWRVWVSYNGKKIGSSKIDGILYNSLRVGHQ